MLCHESINLAIDHVFSIFFFTIQAQMFRANAGADYIVIQTHNAIHLLL